MFATLLQTQRITKTALFNNNDSKLRSSFPTENLQKQLMIHQEVIMIALNDFDYLVWSFFLYLIILTIYFTICFNLLPHQNKSHFLIRCWTTFNFNHSKHSLWHCSNKLMQCHKIYFHVVLHSFFTKIT